MGIAPMERNGVSGRLFIAALCLWTWGAMGNGAEGTNRNGRATVMVAVGAAGEAEFGKEFAKWAELWTKAIEKAGAKQVTVGLAPTNARTDAALLQQALASEPTNSTAELWLVLIGHGTFDGHEARFNLRGPDLSATELAGWLKPFQRPIIVINCTAASSPFISKLSAPDRVILTATRSGAEENFAWFGKYLAESVADPEADLDKDGQTSVLEAFILASRRAGEFYKAAGRLATEHALLDDNGDGLGTPADFFSGVRAVKKPAGGGSVDGLRARQIQLVHSEQEQRLPPELRARRNDLEQAVARLRELKGTLPADEYYGRLEKLMLELAKVYEPPTEPD